MNWFTNFVRPKLNALMRTKDVPDNLWDKCTSCEQMIFHKDLVANLHVCRHCNHHMRMPVADRLASMFDHGEYVIVPVRAVPLDPLKFKDSKKYADRLKAAKHASGGEEAIVVAEGTIGGNPVVIAAFDFNFIGGSMGMAVGEGLLAAAEKAVKNKAAFLTIPASGGARMQEGILSLMQMPRSIVATQMVKEAGLPYLTLLVNPTMGGVSASFAMVGDIAMAEPGALIGFTGARVIQEAINTSLPEGFQSAEFQLDHGMVDMVIPRHQVRDRLKTILSLVMKKKN